MFVTGNGKSEDDNELNEYTLDTPFFVETGVTHINIEDLSSSHSLIDGIVFNYDGTKMYITDSVDNKIEQYKLTTAFNIATLSLQGTLDLSNYSGLGNARETAFNSDGFTVGDRGEINGNTNTIVAWCWKAGGTASSNTDGDITTTVSVNQEAGFSIVTWSGDGNVNSTVGHGLDGRPDFIMLKCRTSGFWWRVYHR